MKQIYLKFSMLLLCLVVGLSSAWGTDVTWIASAQGYTNGTQYKSATVDSYISLAFGDGTNDGKYYNTGTGIRLYSNGKMTISASNATINKIVVTYSNESYTGTMSANVGSYRLSSTTGTWTGSASSVTLENTATSGHARIQKVAITYTSTSGGGSSTTTVTAPTLSPAAGTYVGTQTVKVGNYDSNLLYAYTTDGSDPAIDDELEVTGTTYDNNNGIEITSSCTLKVIAADEDGNTSSVTTAAYTIEASIANTAETAYTVAEAKALVDANSSQLATTSVYVKGTVSKVGYAYNSTNKNLTFDLSADGTTSGQQFQCYKCSAETDPNVSIGDDIVAYGLLTKYGTTYEFNEGNTIASHVKATTLSIANISVAMDGDISPVVETNITGEYAIEYVSSDNDIVYADGDEMITATKTGTATITATIVADGYKTATTTFTVTVTSNATLSSIAISGDLTKSTYTVGDDFDFSGLTATGTMSDASTVDLTNAVTWSIEPATLTAATTSVTVKATRGAISGTKAYDVTVNKKTATITIADITLSKTDANVAISAETTPAEASLTYSIVSGSEYVSLSDGKLSAVAPGEATIKAEYAGNDEYAAAEKQFTVTVNNQMIATVGSFTTGDNTGSHNFTNNTDVSFEAFKGYSATDPAVYSGCLRLYQAGGYVAISGVKGVKIQSITLTTGSTYASTTVGYCVDNGDAPTTGKTVAKSSSYTISDLNNQKVEIYCLGTDKNTRLDIASLEVKYTKEDVTLSSIAVSGTYETSFIKNAEFNHNGAVVTATFSDGDKQDVTSSAVFTEPDMTTTGEKAVNISYTHEGVEKTTSYTITVSEEIVTEIALTGTYTKVFKTSDTFNHDGVVVTATYNSGRSAVVEDAEFSNPDLSTAGAKTVTVTYAGKQATYDIKVIPANAIFFESFDGNDGTGGNDDKWSGSIAANNITSDNEGWTFAQAKGADKCTKFGSGSAAGSAMTPAITLSGNAKITFKAAAWNGNSEVTTLNLSATSGTLSQTSVEMTKAAWTEYTVYLTDVETSTQITFAASQSNNNRFFLDEVLVEEIPTVAVTISEKCYDTDKETGDKIYYSTFSTGKYIKVPTDVTVSEVGLENGKLKVASYQKNDIVAANRGLLISSSTPGKKYFEIHIPSGSGPDETVLLGKDNLLIGTGDGNGYTANDMMYELEVPSYFYRLTMHNGTQIGFWWGAEKGAAFALGANKAFLVVPQTITDGGTDQGEGELVKASFWITDDDATSISAPTIENNANDAIYNLNGQRVNTVTKGMYIKNGKKYFVK